MSDNISTMNDRQLRNEVQLLRDELAIMKRKYEDIIYNLDTDNFSSRFVKEQGNMKTAIEVNAKGIATKVSNEEFESTKTQTAQKIVSEVKKLTDADNELSSKITQEADKIRSEVASARETIDTKFENYSTIEQTDNKINAKVTEVKEYAEGYVTDKLANGDYVTKATFKSQFDIYADGIYSTVEANYQSVNDEMDTLRGSVSSVEMTAGSISSRVSDIENGEFGGYTLFEQTSDKFSFTGNVEIQGATFVSGTIAGSEFKNGSETHALKMSDEGYGTFSLYNDHYGDVPYFSIYDNTFGVIAMYAAGERFLRATKSDGMTVEPIGTWDFSNTDEVKIILPGGAGSGGTVVAVFG